MHEWKPLNRRRESRRALLVFMLAVVLIGVVLILAHADIDYNPPVTQAEDTAAEMGRQNDEDNQRQAAAEADAERYSQQLEQERKDRELQAQIDKLEKEQNDNSRNVH